MALISSVRSTACISKQGSRIARPCVAPVRASQSRSFRRIVVNSGPADVTPAPEPATSDTASTSSVPAKEDVPEVTFYEGNGGSNTELAVSLLLAGTLIYAPLTLASVGRRLWLSYKFTNKRIVITNTSPLFKGEVQLGYGQIKEVRAVGRAFGAWGDMVIFLKNGGTLELLGMENYKELKDHIERCMWTL